MKTNNYKIQHFWSQIVHEKSLRHWNALSARIHKRAIIRVYDGKSAQIDYKGPVLQWPFNRPGWVARDKSAGNLSLKKPPKTVSHGFTFPIPASYSCRKLLAAEVWTIWACTAVLETCTVSFNGRDRTTDQRLVYGKSTGMPGSFLPFSFPEKCTV